MSYKPHRTVAERRVLDAERQKRVRNWRPNIRELCPAAAQVKNRAPSATKTGPGRVSLSLVAETRRKQENWT